MSVCVVWSEYGIRCEWGSFSDQSISTPSPIESKRSLLSSKFQFPNSGSHLILVLVLPDATTARISIEGVWSWWWHAAVGTNHWPSTVEEQSCYLPTNARQESGYPAGWNIKWYINR